MADTTRRPGGRQRPVALPRKSKAEQVIDAFLRIMYESRRQSQQLKEQMGVTAPQLRVLQALLRAGPLTHSALADHLFLTASTVSGIVDRLEREDLVSRTRDQGDRRVVTIALSEAGRRVAAQTEYRLLDPIRQYLEELPERELETFLRTLDRVLATLEAGSAG